MQELLGKAAKASKAFEARHGREPTAEELAPELGVDASRIRDAWEAVTNPRSLDQPMGDADGGTLGDVVEVGGTASCADVPGCSVVMDAVHASQTQHTMTRPAHNWG
jgi:DNA-directed RNA polymerase sigma subunit (sigma70/sigma32)